MKFQLKHTDLTREKTQCLIVPIFEMGILSAAANTANKACHGLIKQVIKRQDTEGKQGQLYLLPLIEGLACQRILLLGCGKPTNKSSKQPIGKLSVSVFQQVVAKLAAYCQQQTFNEVALCFDALHVEGRDIAWQGQVISQSFEAQPYRFDQYKSKKTTQTKTATKAAQPNKDIKTVTLINSLKNPTAYKKGLKTGQAIAKGMRLAKDLGNAPGNTCTPSYLAKYAQKMARQYPKLQCKSLNEKQMEKLGMEALLSVSAGSIQPAKLIIMEYKGAAKNQPPHVLVGKGVTFDSGGISLKPGAAMDEMKYDMCGAASVFGAMQAINDLKLPINVVGIVAAAENMPSSRATKPGDIIRSMSGQTIEVLNTDAEGRLVLCDALTYSERFKPQSIIDIATLTGACVVALGSHAHGLYSNQEDFAQELLAAGTQANDRAWHMPLWKEYDKQINSPFADMGNIGGPGGGSITAACFLARFAKNQRWAHLDIAGTAWKKSPKGATGKPVPLLVQYLIQQSAKK